MSAKYASLVVGSSRIWNLVFYKFISSGFMEMYSFKIMNRYIYHHDDVIMSPMASQITSLMIVYSNVYSGTYKRKYQSSAVTGEIPAQKASKAEIVTIWWRHHDSFHNSSDFMVAMYVLG